jgi:hypothetical protein
MKMNNRIFRILTFMIFVITPVCALFSQDRYWVYMEEIDDIGSIYVNGKRVAECSWSLGRNGAMDEPLEITHLLVPGKNRVKFQLYNKKWGKYMPGGKYSFSFYLYQNKGRIERGYTVYHESQTQPDKSAGIKYSHTEIINYRSGREREATPSRGPSSSDRSLDVPFYVVCSSAWKTLGEAKRKVRELERQGYKAGSLWIPEYESLSGAKMFLVYIGPFKTRRECKRALDNYRRINQGAYGIKVSHDPRREEVR